MNSIIGQGEGANLDLYARIQAAEAQLVGPDGKAQHLPGDLQSFLRGMLLDLEAGRSITIQQNDVAVTTAEAARTLAVSRQFLVNLLEQGQIPFHLVGTHRRVYARDVMGYKVKRDATRRKMLTDLSRREMEEGIYDLIPVDALKRS